MPSDDLFELSEGEGGAREGLTVHHCIAVKRVGYAHRGADGRETVRRDLGGIRERARVRRELGGIRERGLEDQREGLDGKGKITKLGK